jgi:hypothetical protein
MSETNARRAKTVALLGAGVAAGVIGAWALSANAEGSTAAGSGSPGTSAASAPASGPSAPSGPMGPMGGPGGDHRGPGGAPGQRPDETLVTGAKESTLKAAALKQVPGGAIQRVETDSGDAAYEVHMTDADGKQVTVKFDKNLKFVAVEDGMGK